MNQELESGAKSIASSICQSFCHYHQSSPTSNPPEYHEHRYQINFPIQGPPAPSSEYFAHQRPYGGLHGPRYILDSGMETDPLL